MLEIKILYISHSPNTVFSSPSSVAYINQSKHSSLVKAITTDTPVNKILIKLEGTNHTERGKHNNYMVM
jgi:hypothetical protein